MLYRQTPAKITENKLAASCQVIYRKIYVFFFFFLHCGLIFNIFLDPFNAKVQASKSSLISACCLCTPCVEHEESEGMKEGHYSADYIVSGPL